MRPTPTQTLNRWARAAVCAGALIAAFLPAGGCDSDPPVVAPTKSETAGGGGELPPVPTTVPVVKLTAPPVAATADPTSLDIKGPLVEDKYLAKIVQTVVGFDHPCGLAFTPDGKFLYVTNTARTDAGFRKGAGSVSLLSVGDDGRLQMVKPVVASGLDAPVGVAVLPKATRQFPAGAIMVSTGTTNLVDESGMMITDVAVCKPGVTIINPDTGARLGFIPLGPKTAAVKSLFGDSASRTAVVAPAGLEFGPEGDLMVCNAANTGQNVDPPLGNRPGILRIKHRDIDAYAANQMAGDVNWLPLRHATVSMLYTPLDKGFLFWACAGEGVGGGSVWMIPYAAYPQDNMIANVIGGIGPVTGAAVNKRGTCIMSRQEGDLQFITRRMRDSVRFVNEEQPVFTTPGEIRLRTLATGESIVYLPEQEPGPIDHKQRLRVILMPGAY